MKIIDSGDWHGDWVTAGVSRFNEVKAAVDHTVDVAIRERAGLYIFNGDLAEADGPGMLRTLELAVSSAARLWQQHIPSLWLTGNHDVFEDGRNTSNLVPLRDVPGAVLADGPCVHKFGTRSVPNRFSDGKGGKPGQIVTVACLPFTPRTHNYDPAAYLKQLQLDNERPDLIVGHLMLEGIGPGSETRDMPRGRDVFFPVDEARHLFPDAVLVNGHYHTAQVFNGVHLAGDLVRLMQAEASNVPSYLEIDI